MRCGARSLSPAGSCWWLWWSRNLSLISPADGELALSVTGNGGAWAHVGQEPLAGEEYLYVRGGHFDDGWRLLTGWFSPTDPVSQRD